MLVSLLQPEPAVYEVFDDILLLSEGEAPALDLKTCHPLSSAYLRHMGSKAFELCYAILLLLRLWQPARLALAGPRPQGGHFS